MVSDAENVRNTASATEDVYRAKQPTHDVFVSYSSQDKPVADAIVSRLEEAGIRCWVAPRDVLPGTVWGESIVQAIETSRLMVVVLSGQSIESHQVVREVERAVSHDAVVIPFRIESVEPTGAMAYFLASEHWLDAMTPPMESHIAQLVEVAQRLLDRPQATIPAQRHPVEAPPTAKVARGRRRPLLIGAIVGAVLLLALAVTGVVVLTTSAPTLTVSGKVTSALTDAPLTASVTGPGDAVALAGSDGSFGLKDVHEGDMVSVSAPGYHAKSFKARDAGYLTVVLSPLAATVDAQVESWVAGEEYQKVVDWLLRPATGHEFEISNAAINASTRQTVRDFPNIYWYGVSMDLAGYYYPFVDVYLVKSGKGPQAQEGWIKATPELEMIAGEPVQVGRGYDGNSQLLLLSWWHAPVHVLVEHTAKTADQARDVLKGIIRAYS